MCECVRPWLLKYFLGVFTVCFFFLCKLIKRPEGKTNFAFQMAKESFFVSIELFWLLSWKHNAIFLLFLEQWAIQFEFRLTFKRDLDFIKLNIVNLKNLQMVLSFWWLF